MTKSVDMYMPYLSVHVHVDVDASSAGSAPNCTNGCNTLQNGSCVGKAVTYVVSHAELHR